MKAESGMKAGAMVIGGSECTTRKSFSDYVVAVGCWIIDAFVKAVTFVISGAIFMIGGAAFFVVELIVKIVLGVVMLFLGAKNLE